MGLTIFRLDMGNIFYRILSVPHTIVMDMNNVMEGDVIKNMCHRAAFFSRHFQPEKDTRNLKVTHVCCNMG
jgi:hypothetical protein